jgi:hypothetical protein
MVVETWSVHSTVDKPQSASNQQLKHSYLSESRDGPGPTWLSEGGSGRGSGSGTKNAPSTGAFVGVH